MATERRAEELLIDFGRKGNKMENRCPKVSIVLPTYNGARYLGQSIESCLNQTYRDIELIIVDDGSTDATPEIIESFKDPRIKYIRHKKNQRLPGALNTGFRYSTGEYLTWTSDDNQFLPEAIEIMKGCLDKNKYADLVYADYWQYFRQTGEKSLMKLKDILDLTNYNTVGACFLYTRRVYEAVGNYNPNYELVEDYDYWIRITKQFKTIHCPTPLYIYAYHENSLTSQKIVNVTLFHHVLRFQNGFIAVKEIVKHMAKNIIAVIKKEKGKKPLFIILKNLIKSTSISFEAGFLYLLSLIAVQILFIIRPVYGKRYLK